MKAVFLPCHMGTSLWRAHRTAVNGGPAIGLCAAKEGKAEAAAVPARRMRITMAVAALLLASLFAGCSGPPSTPSTGPTTGSVSGTANEHPAEANAAVEPPAWKVGDWWNYTIILGGSGRTSFSDVVSEDRGADWFLDTDNPATAFRNARSDISKLGEIRKSDLAGSQGTTRVEFFQWPLADGKNWTTTWDGQSVHIVATQKGPGLFVLAATRADGTLHAAYTYDRALGWFRDLTYTDAKGTPDLAFSLASSGHAYKGTVVRWKLETLYAANGTNGNADAKPLTVADGLTDLWLAYHLSCAGGGGGYSIAVKPVGADAPTGGYFQGNPCTQVDYEDAIVTSPTPGAWTVAYSWGGGNPMTYAVELLARTLQMIPVG